MTRSRQTADWGSRAGLAKVIPSPVAVGSGTGSANTLGTVTFSGASSVSLNGIFSSTYDNYRILLDSTAASASAALNIRVRVSGADASGSDYNSQRIDIAGTSSTITRNTLQTSFQPDSFRATGLSNAIILDILNPFRTVPTGFAANLLYSYSSFASKFFGLKSVSS